MTWASGTRTKNRHEDVAVTEGEDSLTAATIGAGPTSTGIADLRTNVWTQCFLRNTTDRQVSVQFEVSPDADFTRVHPLGSAITLGIGSVTATKDTASFGTCGYVRATVTPSGGATTVGAVTVSRITQVRGVQA